MECASHRYIKRKGLKQIIEILCPYVNKLAKLESTYIMYKNFSLWNCIFRNLKSVKS